MEGSKSGFFQIPLKEGDLFFFNTAIVRSEWSKKSAKMLNFRAIFNVVIKRPWTIKHGAIRLISAFRSLQGTPTLQDTPSSVLHSYIASYVHCLAVALTKVNHNALLVWFH